MHDAAAVVVMEQVLAPRAGLLQHPAVDGGGAVGEPALRAGHERPARGRIGADAAGPAGAACGLRAPLRPARPAPAARRGCVRTRRGCRYAVGGVRLSTTGWSGRRRRSPAPPATVCMRPPMPISCALLCWRASDAVSTLHASAQRRRAPCWPRSARRCPSRRCTMPRLSGSATRLLRGGDAERRVVVLGVVDEGAAVDRLVAGLAQVLDDRLLEFESGVVRAEVDAHGGHSGRRHAGRCTVRTQSNGRLGAAALELPEVRIGREGHRGVPELAGFLAARDLRQHRAEERDAVDVNGRRADVVADRVHSGVVALAQRLVVLVGGGRLGQLGGQIRPPRATP